MIELLWSYAPYLAGGFQVNLLISIVSMAAGTVFGIMLGRLRYGGWLRLGGVASFGTNICRNVPSFVLLFYMASLLPSEVTVGEQVIAVPLWIKATIALMFPVIGFVSDQSLGYFDQVNRGIPKPKATFAVAWMQYFLIIIMASSTASVIGADEIVGRANTLLSQENQEDILLPMYLFVSLWFIATGLLFSGLLKLALGEEISEDMADA